MNPIMLILKIMILKHVMNCLSLSNTGSLSEIFEQLKFHHLGPGCTKEESCVWLGRFQSLPGAYNPVIVVCSWDSKTLDVNHMKEALSVPIESFSNTNDLFIMWLWLSSSCVMLVTKAQNPKIEMWASDLAILSFSEPIPPQTCLRPVQVENKEKE